MKHFKGNTVLEAVLEVQEPAIGLLKKINPGHPRAGSHNSLAAAQSRERGARGWL